MWSPEYERRAAEMRERNESAKLTSRSINGQSGANQVESNSAAVERHYTAKELGTIWKLSTSSIIRIFRDEPGVLKIERRQARHGRRSYATLRIPQSVVERVYRRMLVR